CGSFYLLLTITATRAETHGSNSTVAPTIFAPPRMKPRVVLPLATLHMVYLAAICGRMCINEVCHGQRACRQPGACDRPDEVRGGARHGGRGKKKISVSRE